jgi:nucleoside-diphosphate-sugar epimerase
MLNKTRRALVIGGGGYVGAELVRVLQSSGKVVPLAVDLGWFGKTLPQEILLNPANAWSLTVDDMADVETVVFLAGLSNDPMAEYSPRLNFLANSALPTYLAYTAKQAGVSRFIFASSCSVYGVSKEVQDETSLPKPGYPYGIAKLQAEAGLMILANESFRVVALRKGTISGVSARLRMDIVLNTMVGNAIVHGRISVHDPTTWRPIVGLKDVVRLYAMLVESEEPPTSGVYNVAQNNYTVLELAQAVQRACHKRDIHAEIEIGDIPSPRCYRADTSKLSRTFGFEFLQTPEDICDELVHHLAAKDRSFFDESRLYNIRTFMDVLRDDVVPVA